jgi:hypothetical protein
MRWRWLHRACVSAEDYGSIFRQLVTINSLNEALRAELRAATLKHDPRAHVDADTYGRLEEKYDVLYRRHAILAKELDQYRAKEARGRDASHDAPAPESGRQPA